MGTASAKPLVSQTNTSTQALSLKERGFTIPKKSHAISVNGPGVSNLIARSFWWFARFPLYSKQSKQGVLPQPSEK
jgi:hypothetical protein